MTGTWNHELEAVVAEFPQNLKQAMYAAANKGPIARGTWNHCAFNAAGDEVSAVVNSTHSAAAAFDVPAELVSRFIQTWDRRQGTPEEVTERLKNAILAAGLFEDPTPGKKIVRVMAYQSQVDTLAKLEADGMIENIQEAGELLGAG